MTNPISRCWALSATAITGNLANWKAPCLPKIRLFLIFILSVAWFCAPLYKDHLKFLCTKPTESKYIRMIHSIRCFRTFLLFATKMPCGSTNYYRIALCNEIYAAKWLKLYVGLEKMGDISTISVGAYTYRTEVVKKKRAPMGWLYCNPPMYSVIVPS